MRENEQGYRIRAVEKDRKEHRKMRKTEDRNIELDVVIPRQDDIGSVQSRGQNDIRKKNRKKPRGEKKERKKDRGMKLFETKCGVAGVAPSPVEVSRSPPDLLLSLAAKRLLYRTVALSANGLRPLSPHHLCQRLDGKFHRSFPPDSLRARPRWRGPPNTERS